MKLKLDYAYDNYDHLSEEEKQFLEEWYIRICRNDFNHDSCKQKIKNFIDSNKREEDVLRFLNKMNYNQWDFILKPIDVFMKD